jgi:hypothetical protein
LCRNGLNGDLDDLVAPLFLDEARAFLADLLEI